jgi:hypothetical protein
VKFERTDAFAGDYRRRLDARERERFKSVVKHKFVPAAERYAADPSIRWPGDLRVKPIEGARGVWEMRWSFAGPDGRATWEWIDIDGERGVRWRRVGGHAIFRSP